MATSNRETSESAPGTIRFKPGVFIGSAVSIIAIAIWTLISPTTASDVLYSATGWIGQWFGWFYILLGTAVVVFVVSIAMSRYGKMRLGPENSRPEFSTLSWAAMLFAAGIGSDLLFFSVAEPVTQYMAPPEVEPQSIEAAEQGPVWAIFHYGLTGWAMYALMGMVLGYFAHRHGKRIAARSALEPIFGDKIHGVIGDIVDMAAMLGTVFGVATTLGIGVVQINVGLNLIFGLEEGLPIQILLICAAVLMAGISAVSGVARGIRFLSQANVVAAIILAIWVLLGGRTDFLLNAVVMNIGDLVATFPSMTMDTMAFSGAEEWKNLWTLFFWAWWVAWASFVGMFLARISRGRTLRQFVAGCMTIPFMYIVMWISIFGNAAIDYVRNHENGQAFGEITAEIPEYGFYTLLQDMPGHMPLMILATIVAFLFYVTSADSGALVMANLCSELPTPTTDAKPWLRFFWAAVTGMLTIGMLLVGGIYALQSAAVIMGLPFAFVMVLAMWGFWKTLRADGRRILSREKSATNVVAGAGTHSYYLSRASWKDRVSHSLGSVSPEQAREFMTVVVQPALEALATEMGTQGGVDVTVTRADTDVVEDIAATRTVYDRVRFSVADGGEEFIYRILATDGPARDRAEGSSSARLEVHTSAGGHDYDVMGYSAEAIIHDVLNHFERHQEFLRAELEADTSVSADTSSGPKSRRTGDI